MEEIEELRHELSARERELDDARAQREALGRILAILTASSTALEPVLKVVAESATRLCKTDGAAIFRLDGGLLYFAAGYFPESGESWETLIPRAGIAVDRHSVPGRPIHDRATFHVEDLDVIPESQLHAPVGRRLRMRSLLSVPLLRDGEATGSIVVQRKQSRPFTADEIELMETFADQATIAIEQARLFQELTVERRKSEALLLNVLPSAIAERLKRGEEPIADAFAETTVLFADIVDFTGIASHASPEAMVSFLNQVFSDLDALALKHGLEKIKTVGDAYMAVGGLPEPRPDHAEAAAEMALDILRLLEERTAPTGVPLRMRIGINTGPAVAGVIGTSKFAYDLWGDTVNTASRMESHGVPGAIQVTESTRERLAGSYRFESRGLVDIKGKGTMPVFLLTGRLS